MEVWKVVDMRRRTRKMTNDEDNEEDEEDEEEVMPLAFEHTA